MTEAGLAPPLREISVTCVWPVAWKSGAQTLEGIRIDHLEDQKGHGGPGFSVQDGVQALVCLSTSLLDSDSHPSLRTTDSDHLGRRDVRKKLINEPTK